MSSDNDLVKEAKHLDSIFWKPGWISTPKNEQRDVQEELVSHDSWIIDGNYGGTIDIRFQAADTIIFIDLSRWICIIRVLKRRFQYRNKTRTDMAEGCEERISLEFLKWVWEYPEKQKTKILGKLRWLSNEKEIIILKTLKDVREFVTNVELLK
ncbi:adenylate kinase family enzyme [Paenibacillus castaneae]|uniref:topology modulation protein n=1 Tax=Paenibacillus castaneae TaxID=474957 RepID=UPI0011AF2260|nr:topology modulation protein [Paenibacillus castaneae]NIK79694.1 adenylate kinase family enzyme [Paenibacillus castaneae]